MEPKRRSHTPPTRLLVCHGHDDLVSRTQWLHLSLCSLIPISIIIPWFSVRKVPVDIELVSPAKAMEPKFVRFKRKRSRRLKLRLFVSNVECNKVSLGVSAALPLWSTTRSEL